MHRPDIDGLRSIAVLSVLFFHAGFTTFSGGFVGVDVFFVISGFLITRLIVSEVEAGEFTFRGFYLRRVRRLFPALAATLLLTLAFAAWILSPQDLRQAGRTAIFGLLSVSNIQFWQEIGYFKPAAELNPLLHTWSLAVEEQFYFIWPLTLVLLMKARRAWLVPTVLVVLTVLSAVASQWALGTADSASFYLLPFRVFELGIGALMVWGLQWKPARGWLLDALALLGLAMIAWATFVFTKDTPFPGVNALIPCLGTALLIFAGEAPRVGLLLRNRLAVGIGLVSYSLYLVHWPLLVLFGRWKFQPETLTERIVLVIVAIALSVLFYFFIEKPFRKPKRVAATSADAPPAPRNRRFLGGVAATAVLLLACSGALWATKGWPQRFEMTPQARKLMAGQRWDSSLRGWHMDAPELRIAVLGDSHVAAYMGLKEWGETRNIEFVRFVGTGGCPPLVDVLVHGSVKQSEQCIARKDRELERIANGEFDAVVLFGRWGLYTGELTPNDHIRPRYLTLPGDADDAQTRERSREVFVEGLRRTVARMREAGKPVIFVGQVPPLGMTPYPCVVRKRNWKEVERDCIVATYDEMVAEAAWATEAAIAESRGGEAFLVVDPFPLFCADGRCRITERGQMLYRDDNHLSHAGTRKLAAVLGPQVEALARAQLAAGDAATPVPGSAEPGGRR